MWLCFKEDVSGCIEVIPGMDKRLPCRAPIKTHWHQCCYGLLRRLYGGSRGSSWVISLKLGKNIQLNWLKTDQQSHSIPILFYLNSCEVHMITYKAEYLKRRSCAYYVYFAYKKVIYMFTKFRLGITLFRILHVMTPERGWFMWLERMDSIHPFLKGHHDDLFLLNWG